MTPLEAPRARFGSHAKAALRHGATRAGIAEIGAMRACKGDGPLYEAR